MTTTTSACTTHDVRIDITVAAEVWRGLYDRIEVHRSVLGESGPYEEVTAASWSYAFVPHDAGLPSAMDGRLVNIVGKTLQVKAGSTLLEVTFTGTDPLTLKQVATQATTAFVPYANAHVDEQGHLYVQSNAVGGQARLEVLSGDAASLLGLPITAPENVSYGADPRLPLVEGVQSYVFRDYYGKTSYFYKVRFSNALTGAQSDFSGPISAVPPAGLSDARLITGFLKLVRGDGMPDVKQQVSIFMPSTLQKIDGASVNGGERHFLTDSTGRIEVRLIRGTDVDVGIGGMNLMRRITVPTDPALESFDLLDPEVGKDDSFAVQRIDLPYAEKMNL